MNRRAVQLAAAAIFAPATLALGQPTITSLGGGIPLSVTNDIAGTRYIAGLPYGSATGAGRWTLTGGSLVFSNPAGSAGLGAGGTRLSADGRYQIGTILNSPQYSGNTAAGVAPPFSLTPTLVPSLISATEHRAARWDSTTSTWSREVNQLGVDPSQMIYGQGAAGGGTMLTPHAISANGRFIVGASYISNYNSSAGTTIAVSTFTWRPFIWDADANGGLGAITPLITPMRTSSNTWRRRTGDAFAVSNDGLVVCGWQERNVSSSGSADPDGGRPIVWRWNAGTSTYDMTYLNTGTDGSGFPLSYSASAGSMFMNNAGTVICANSPAGPAKWVWNAGTSNWDGPTVLGTFTGSSWLPSNQSYGGPGLGVLGMSEDGNTVVGSVRYSNGSFIQGGWIWTAGAPTNGNIVDWYDYLASQNTAGTAPGPTSNYGPIGVQSSLATITCSGGVATANTNFDHGMVVGNTVVITGNSTPGYNGLKVVTAVPSTTSFEFAATCDVDGTGGIATNYSKGMPRLGNPDGVSADGSVVVGHQGGTTIIIGAMPWITQLNGGTCVAPSITTTPANTTFNFSRCNRFVNITVTAQGTNPTFQWYRNNGGSPIALTDGVTASGMTVTGSGFPALSLVEPAPSDADTYYCVVTNSCGSVNSANFTVQVDPSIPALASPVFSSCSAAEASAGVGPGTYPFNPCGVFDTAETISCITSPGVTTRSAVWFKYVPPADGEARFQTCGGTYDSNITLWSGCGGGELACNDDVGSGVTGCSSNRSRIARINVFSGVPILVRVAGTGTALSATGSLQIIQPAPARPANDDCGTANVLTIPIAGVPITVAQAYDLTEATTDGSASCAASFRDIWYKFTPAARGTIRAYTCTASPTYDSVLSFHSSCFGGVELACNDNQTGGPAPCSSTQSMVDNYIVTQPNVGANIYMRVAQKSLSTNTTGTYTLIFTASCPADYDGDGNITPADVAAFVNAWFASLTNANQAGDFDGNGAVQPADVAAFVNNWFNALSNPC